MKKPIQIFVVFLSFAVMARSETILQVDFNNGYDAAYATGNPKADQAKTAKLGDVSLIEGKFGQGVRVGREVPAYALNYRLPKNFDWSEGTVEFWFKPEWDTEEIESEDYPIKNLRGKPLSVILFAAGNSPNGVSLSKTQYNYLTFAFTNRYQREAFVDVKIAPDTFFQRGKWVHLACSWNKNEGRIFANGRLLAVSDLWDKNVSPGKRFALGCGKYGKGRGAMGCFDELRISDQQCYISSFTPLDNPFIVEKASKKPRKALKSLGKTEKTLGKASSALFQLDFTEGLKPKLALGGFGFRSNRKLKLVGVGDQKGLRLSRFPEKTGDTLAYLTEENINLFLGRLSIRVQVDEKVKLPAILFESTHLSRLGLTGIRFQINKKCHLEWICLENGRILAKLVAPKPIPTTEKDLELGFSWGNAKTVLYLDNAKVAEKKGVPMPERLGRYFFVGSNCRGDNTFEGIIKSLEIKIQ